METYIDISIPVDARTPVFPGDPGAQVSWPSFSHAAGDDLNLGVYHGGLHVGTHVDAPWHYIKDGDKLEHVPLDRWVGECFVLDLPGVRAGITKNLLLAHDWPEHVTRLLLKTANSEDRYWEHEWSEAYAYLDATAAAYLVLRGVQTVGFDYVTIEGWSATDFPAHKCLLGAGVVILEGLNLSSIAEGFYELVAAPVKLMGVDGAWCRALLKPLR